MTENQKDAQMQSLDALEASKIVEDDQAQEEDAHEYVIFQVDDEEYGVNILSVREIKGWGQTTRIPGAPTWVKGVLNLRGEIAPIIDIRNKLSMGITSPDKNNVTVIVDVEGRIIGLLVDKVTDIVKIPETLIQAVPGVERSKDAEYILGIATLDQRLVALLDLPKFIQDVGKLDARLSA